ncbi:MAG: hypothetical protein ACK2U1_18335 [Anaerolineales bacterium]
MLVLRLVLIAGLLIGGAGLAWKITPSRSKLLVLRDEPHFPIVSGFNLDRQEFEFPRDFGGDYNLVIVPFQRYHQQIVNTWIPFAQEVEASFPGFIYYEMPTIYEMPALSRTFLNEGMRAGIPDQTARERTITLYLNKDAFKSALGIPNENDIYLFLVDRAGEIVWSSTGAYTAEKADNLLQFIQGQRSGSSKIGFTGS